MLSIIQTNFSGIDGLSLQETEQPQLTDDGLLIKMDYVPITPTDIKRETNPNATKENLATLPRVLGFSGIGTVLAVGTNRDATLLNRRVFLMQPTGSYSEYVVSENPDWLFPLPEAVDSISATGLTATPFVLLDEIKAASQAGTHDFILTGANSVIGQLLIQLLDQADIPIKLWSVVSPSSQAYFHQQFPTKESYMAQDLPQFATAVILDIAGSDKLIETILTRIDHPRIVSIALMRTSLDVPFQFVHEEFSFARYQTLLQQLAQGNLSMPIDQIFPISQVKAAQHYVFEHHSRGRVLLSFHD